MPFLPAGTLSFLNEDGLFEFAGESDVAYTFTEDEITDTEWFIEMVDLLEDDFEEDLTNECGCVDDELETLYQEISDLNAELDDTLEQMEDLEIDFKALEEDYKALRGFAENLVTAVDIVFIVNNLSLKGLASPADVLAALEQLYRVNLDGPRPELA